MEAQIVADAVTISIIREFRTNVSATRAAARVSWNLQKPNPNSGQWTDNSKKEDRLSHVEEAASSGATAQHNYWWLIVSVNQIKNNIN